MTAMNMLHIMLFGRETRQPQQQGLHERRQFTSDSLQVGEDHPDREEESGQDSLEHPLLVAHDRVRDIGPVLA